MLHFFFFNDTATTEIYTLSLHDALPIFAQAGADVAINFRNNVAGAEETAAQVRAAGREALLVQADVGHEDEVEAIDRKSTRLNSSHANISYAVFCLKKKNNNERPTRITT